MWYAQSPEEADGYCKEICSRDNYLKVNHEQRGTSMPPSSAGWFYIVGGCYTGAKCRGNEPTASSGETRMRKPCKPGSLPISQEPTGEVIILTFTQLFLLSAGQDCQAAGRASLLNSSPPLWPLNVDQNISMKKL